LKYWGFIKDPLYGYVHITEVEKKIIDTLPFQRLHRIKQLVFADYVYPGATHTRFEHSIGVMHLAGLLASSLPEQLSPEEIQEVRIAGLLHDVGHGPFSHTYEHLLVKKLGKTHEDLTQWVIRCSELKDVLSENGLDVERVAKLAIGKLLDKGRPFLDQIIRSAVDVDKMDFIQRDSYHTGAEYGKVDIYRLIYTMEIVDGNLAVNITALPTLEAFVLARIESFRTIYYHKTARAGQISLIKAMEVADCDLKLTSFKDVNDFLNLDDYYVWCKLKEHSEARHYILALERRELLKCAYEKVFHVEDKVISSILTNDAVRRKVEEEIANEAEIPVDEVAIDVPSLPSIPYFHSMKFDVMDIPLVDDKVPSRRVLLKATDLSRVLDVLKGFMNIIRVYTSSRNREKVKEAAEKVLGALPESTRVSY